MSLGRVTECGPSLGSQAGLSVGLGCPRRPLHRWKHLVCELELPRLDSGAPPASLPWPVRAVKGSLCAGPKEGFLFSPITVRSCQDGTQGTSPEAQWLRLHAPGTRSLGSIPHQVTRSHTPKLRAPTPRLKIPHVTTKTWHRQINK